MVYSARPYRTKLVNLWELNIIWRLWRFIVSLFTFASSLVTFRILMNYGGKCARSKNYYLRMGRWSGQLISLFIQIKILKIQVHYYFLPLFVSIQKWQKMWQRCVITRFSRRERIFLTRMLKNHRLKWSLHSCWLLLCLIPPGGGSLATLNKNSRHVKKILFLKDKKKLEYWRTLKECAKKSLKVKSEEQLIKVTDLLFSLVFII